MTESREYFVTADALLTDDGFIRNKSLHVKDGKIEGLPEKHLIPEHSSVLEYPGCVITPCFCDYHLHFFNGSAEKIAAVTADLHSSGITTVFEGGDKNSTGLSVKKHIRNKLHVKASGCAIYKKGTYGRYIGKGVESINEARDLINKLKEHGADYIKIINSGIFEPESGEITPGGFKTHELSEIMKYAAGEGLQVACHANGDPAVRDAVKAGASYIIHGLHVMDETLSLMTEKKTAFVPTVHAFESLKSIATGRKAIYHIEKAVESQLNVISRALDLQVHILPGSDSGPSFIQYGKSYWKELKLFHKTGMSLELILISAAGTFLAQGMQADFAVIQDLDLQKVFLHGNVIV